MHIISRRTADEAWRDVTAMLVDTDQSDVQTSRAGKTRELLHVGICIEDPSQRWVTSRTPSMNPAFALVEVFWIASGREDAALPTYWNPALPRFCGMSPRFHGAYGHRLRKHFGIDQLDRVYKALMASPDSRQCVLQLWDPAIDLPGPDGAPSAQDIPCNIVALPKVRRGKLEWMQIIRSNDVFLGLPHNIVQFTALQEMLSGWLGIAPGEYFQLSDSLHIYSSDLEAARGSLAPVVATPSTDSFALDRVVWDRVITDVISRLEEFTQGDLSQPAFKSAAFAGDAPAAYNNAVLVAAADAARRRGWGDLAQQCIERCSDPALVHLWHRWRARIEGVREPSIPAAAISG